MRVLILCPERVIEVFDSFGSICYGLWEAINTTIVGRTGHCHLYETLESARLLHQTLYKKTRSYEVTAIY